MPRSDIRRASAPLALAMLGALGCRGPSLSYDEDSLGEDASADADTHEGDTDDAPFTCEPWPEPPAALGMGETAALNFVDVSAELGLVDTAYYPGDWPPGCDPAGEGWVQTPCKMELQGGGAAVGDFDDDGWPDIYLSRLVGPGLLFRNLNGVGFEEVGLARGLDQDQGGNGAAWVDIDGDEDLDLYVTTLATPGRFWLFVNQLAETGEASFVEDAHARGLALDDGLPHFGFSVAVGDYDGDGWLDLYTTEWWPGGTPTEETSHARLLRNLGAAGEPGVFEDRTAAAGASMLMQNPAGLHAFAPAFVDLDEDGWLDLAVVSDNGTSRLFFNDGAGGFEDFTPKAGVSLERNGMGSTFGDYDGDAHLDWYVSAIFSPDEDIECGNSICGRGGNRLYRSRGPRCFEELAEELDVQIGGWGWGTSVWDPDNDGDLDLVETNGFQVPHGPPGTYFTNHPLRLWRNVSEVLGAAGFDESSASAGLVDAGQGRGLVAFDYDRDGDEDLLVVDNAGRYGTSTKLWRNETGNQNAWLDVELEGAGGNRHGVGARVELRRFAGGPTQVRIIGLGAHFLGQGENRAHFGLGPLDSTVHELRVTWPSGEVSVFSGLVPGQTLVVAEP